VKGFIVWKEMILKLDVYRSDESIPIKKMTKKILS